LHKLTADFDAPVIMHFYRSTQCQRSGSHSENPLGLF